MAHLAFQDLALLETSLEPVGLNKQVNFETLGAHTIERITLEIVQTVVVPAVLPLCGY